MTKNIISLNKQNIFQSNFQSVFLNDRPENLYQHELHFTHSSSENKEISSNLSNVSNSKTSENPNQNKTENEEEDEEIIESNEDEEMAVNINNIHNLIENNTLNKDKTIKISDKKEENSIDKNSSSYLSKSQQSKQNEEIISKKSKDKKINEEKKIEDKNIEEKKEDEEEKTLSNIKNIEKNSSSTSKINSSFYVPNEQTEIQNEFELLKNKSNCTYFKFGNYNVNQPVFYCENCDPNKTERICFQCFNICHKQCHSISINKNNIETNSLPNNFINEIENDKIKKFIYLTFI